MISGKRKLNCWEYMKCGFGPSDNTVDKEECIAATAKSYDGINEGLNGGRICWKVAGTFCSSQINGRFAKKIFSCQECPFFKHVHKQGEDQVYFTLNGDPRARFLSES